MMKSIVIGSGFGGIAAALRLRAKKHEVTLIEKQNDLGGRARVFNKNGFIFDAGPTIITAPHLKKFTELPIAVGFGIKNKKDVKKLSRNVEAVVVGSSIIKKIRQPILTLHEKAEVAKDVLELLRKPGGTKNFAVVQGYIPKKWLESLQKQQKNG